MVLTGSSLGEWSYLSTRTKRTNERQSVHDHANVGLRTKQWCYRIDSMCQPQSWLCLLLLASHYGDLCQIRCSSRHHSIFCARWYDHILVLCSVSRWYSHHVDNAMDSTQSLHPDSSSHFGVWRDISANLGESDITHRDTRIQLIKT